MALNASFRRLVRATTDRACEISSFRKVLFRCLEATLIFLSVQLSTLEILWRQLDYVVEGPTLLFVKPKPNYGAVFRFDFALTLKLIEFVKSRWKLSDIGQQTWLRRVTLVLSSLGKFLRKRKEPIKARLANDPSPGHLEIAIDYAATQLFSDVDDSIHSPLVSFFRNLRVRIQTSPSRVKRGSSCRVTRS